MDSFKSDISIFFNARLLEYLPKVLCGVLVTVKQL